MWIDLLLAAVVAAVLASFLALGTRFAAPCRKNTPLRSVLGYFLPLLMLSWGGMAAMTTGGGDVWGTLWLVFGLVALGVALLLARPASPREPSAAEERRASRRNKLLDPVWYLYVLGMSVGLLAACVTRIAWVEAA